MKYYLYYELGIHHITIETNKKDFYEVINDISTEFEIHIRENIKENTLYYSIRNYYEELQKIGYIKIEQ